MPIVCDEPAPSHPAHDFPQRVIYRRASDRLHARVEALVAGKLEAAQWVFSPRSSAAGAPACR